jgi:mycothione reductase
MVMAGLPGPGGGAGIMKEYDLVVIGSGAGLMVLEAALDRGMKCAVIERAKFGGTCLTKGCIPSKMLVYPADLIRETEAAQKIGLKIPKPQIEWETISRRMWEQINFNIEVENHLKKIPNLTIYKGIAEFSSPNRIVITHDSNQPAEEIQGDKFLIAVGARTFIPDIAGLDQTGYLTSETFFGKKFPDKLWKSLVIIGGGAISAEFAHIFSSFGTRVTVIEMNHHILHTEEEEISEFVNNQFVKNGIDVWVDSQVVSASINKANKMVTVENIVTKNRMNIECEEIFVASGIKPNSDTLKLENAGVAVDKKGWIMTNQFLETSQKNIWALGDINGKYQFRHKANYEAEILIHNMVDGITKKEVNYDTVPWAIFTHPQVAHVGMTEKIVKSNNIKYRTAKNYYSDVIGGRAMGYSYGDDDNGFIKIIVGEDRKILGVHIVGPNAAILVQPFVYLMNAGHKCQKDRIDPENIKEIAELRIMCPKIGTYVPINDSMVIHPSLNELTAWVLDKIDWKK